VTNSSGQEVRRLSLGKQTTGTVQFSWDGKDSSGNQAPSGIYHVKATSTVNGTTQSFTTQLQATVQSVSLGQGGQGMTLNLTGLGGHNISEIQAIL
jgi:flagellar basal-body rod modification protein FlgD